ncbi:MAG: hypothetical protein OHK0039_46710 [Bacteroidia bacterium]
MRKASKSHPHWEVPAEYLVMSRYEPLNHTGQQQAAFRDHLLHALQAPETFDVSFLRSFPLPIILDYLYRTHDYYLGQRLDEIEQSVDRLIHQHGTDFPALQLLRTVFERYQSGMRTHVQEEETVLFPYLAYIYECYQYGERYARRSRPVPAACRLEDFSHPASSHAIEEALDLLMETLLHRYPVLAELMSFDVLRTQLDAMNRDLELHEQVENDVLIPVAMQLLAQMGM